MQGAHALLADHCEPAGSCTGEAGTPSLQPCEELIFEDGGSAGLKLKMFQGADQHCTVGLLSKMAVDRLSSFFIHLYSHLAPNNFPTTFFFLYNTHDRTLNSSLADAREAFINVCVDAIERWKLVSSRILVFVNRPERQLHLAWL